MAEDKKVLVSFHMSGQLWSQIKRAAKQGDIPASQLLRHWISNGFKELKGIK